MSKQIVPTVLVEQFDIQKVEIPIIGIAPLVVHRFGGKSIKMIQDKQGKKASKGKEKRDPEKEYLDSRHMIDDKRTGFPASGFKKALVRGAKYTGLVMTDVRANLFVEADDVEKNLVEIKGKYRMRTDHVRIGQGTTDLRYRPEYLEWECVLTISFNKNVLSLDQIFTMVHAAGYGCGIGENRPERGGDWGRFALKDLVNKDRAA